MHRLAALDKMKRYGKGPRKNFIAPFEIEWILFTVNEQMKKIECAGGKETQKMNNSTQTD